MKLLYLFFIPILSFGQDKLFNQLTSEQTGISFQNIIEDDVNINFTIYPYFYNGAGVAIGDIDNDGFSDIFFTGNVSKCKLYKNKGDMKFEDITLKAGVEGNSSSYYTGVSMVDINQDGWLDIYLCKTLFVDSNMRRNELYINNHDGTFTEKAKQFGLDDPGYSNQAYFRDMDNDGDIDMFLTNIPSFPPDRDLRSLRLAYGANNELKAVEEVYSKYTSNRLYENVNGFYKDITDKSGIMSSHYGLSALLEDFNGDGLIDIYVANDFKDNDRMWINQGKNVFKNEHEKLFNHSSFFSMGSDYADINNDGLGDLMVLDMLPENLSRIKQLRRGDNYDQFNVLVKYGFGHQYVKNVLQLNNGNSTYSDIGFSSGMSRTDWSWAPIIADFDNDGWKDVYITNGYYRDITDLDYMVYQKDSLDKLIRKNNSKIEIQNLLNNVPSTKVRNYFFKNQRDLSFGKMSKEAGIDDPSWSNGGAYSDLDNDGDLDLVINNINQDAFVYKNNASDKKYNNFLSIKLIGPEKNKQGIGAKIIVHTPKNDLTQTYICNPYKGFLSSHDSKLIVGIFKNDVCNVTVVWPDGKKNHFENQKPNQFMTVDYNLAKLENEVAKPNPIEHFEDITKKVGLDIPYKENYFVDFKLEPLLPHRLSQMGPCIAVGDINGDQLDDVVMGGSVGVATSVFVQDAKGKFKYLPSKTFEADKQTEDGYLMLLDYNKDGHKDLLIGCGGNEFSLEPDKYLLKLYKNNGKGEFIKVNILNNISVSTKTMTRLDYNRDGIEEIFIGGLVVPGHYGRNPKSYIIQLSKEGKINIIDSSDKLGMVTCATWGDIDRDGWMDLLTGGEWQPLVWKRNDNGVLNATPSQITISNGWWRSLKMVDIDNDGDMDIVAGNHGTNSQYQGNENSPLQMLVNDFDKNGSTDCIINMLHRNDFYPLAIRDNFLDQMPVFKKKFYRYNIYSNSSMSQIFSMDQLNSSQLNFANEFKSIVLVNMGGLNFIKMTLPVLAQTFPINGIIAKDIDNDKIMDLIVAGNDYSLEVETGQIDAGNGLVLKGDGGGNFEALDYSKTHLSIPGDVKCIEPIVINGKSCFIAGKNNAELQVVEIK